MTSADRFVNGASTAPAPARPADQLGQDRDIDRPEGTHRGGGGPNRARAIDAAPLSGEGRRLEIDRRARKQKAAQTGSGVGV
jgi:hypothetical protein